MTSKEKGDIAESFVFELANKSILNFWCYQNPIDENGNKKEICDLLILFRETCLICEVKNYEFKGDYERYNRKTLKKAASQLQGAERKLFKSNSKITLNHPFWGMNIFDKKKYKNIHRLIIHFGEGLLLGHPGTLTNKTLDFIHVFTKKDFQDLMDKLTTISDLIEYFNIREKLFNQTGKIILSGGEKGLIGLFLTSRSGFKEYIDGLNGKNVFLDLDESWDYFETNTLKEEPLEIQKVAYFVDDIVQRDLMSHEGGWIISQELMSLNRFERKLFGIFFFDFFYKVINKGFESSRRQHIVVGNLAITFFYYPEVYSEKLVKSMMEVAAEGYSLFINYDFTNSIVIGFSDNKPLQFLHVEVEEGYRKDELLEILKYLDWFQKGKQQYIDIKKVASKVDTEGVIQRTESRKN